ncbi:MAG: response regulator transcription factor [Bacteroidota bacterium]|nr:response regulator transcription factor [Bacteroidota bacterium]
MKILVIEDERKLAKFIKQGLEQQGYIVDAVFSGTEGLNLLSGGIYDVVLLDLMLPGQTGFEVLKNMRSFNIKVPVIILSALSDPEKVVEGLDLGALDYIRKPFDFAELLARIRAVKRKGAFDNDLIIEVADLRMDLIKHEIYKAGKKLELTNREFALLDLFMRKKDKLITKTEIAEKVWEVDFDMGSNVIEVHIYQLRKKLDEIGMKNLISTVVGRGYKMADAE